jgi:hypothetical protein
MPRLFAVLTAAALFVAGAPAGARTVRSGNQNRLKRVAILDVSQALWEPYDLQDEGLVRMFSYGREPRSGERFVLVDTKGPYAAIEVREAEQMNTYGGPPSWAVYGRYTESPLRAPVGETAALGPTQRSLNHARVLPYGPVEYGPNPDGSYPMLAVDGDGDGRAEFLVQSTMCAEDVTARWPDWGMDCFNSWAKEGSAWKVVEKSLRAYEGD